MLNTVYINKKSEPNLLWHIMVGSLAGMIIFFSFKCLSNYQIFYSIFDVQKAFKTNLLIGISIAIGLATVLALLPVVITQKSLYLDKISGFECGFEPFNEARSEFYIKFYHVAALFLLFEIELLVLFPFSVIFIKSLFLSVKKIIIWTFLFFFFCIGLGLYIEWNKNVLDWE